MALCEPSSGCSALRGGVRGRAARSGRGLWSGPARRAVLVGATLTGLAAWLAGCTGGPTEQPAPTDEGTPLASYGTDRLSVARAGFCDLVDADAVRRALGAEREREDHYDNGDRQRLAPGVTDVAHEYGCSWSAAGVTARAWVFAPPVTRVRADDLVAQAVAEKGCTTPRAAAEFGVPSVVLVCRGADGVEASYRGLFVDAWLSCSLALPAGDPDAAEAAQPALLDRTGRWCVAAAEAAHEAFAG